jgi:hypothetical protein
MLTVRGFHNNSMIQISYESTARVAAQVVVKAVATKARQGAKKGISRVSYKSGENKSKLEAAVAEWQTKTGRCTATAPLKSFAALVGIPEGTLANYVTKVGNAAGRVGREFSLSLARAKNARPRDARHPPTARRRARSDQESDGRVSSTRTRSSSSWTTCGAPIEATTARRAARPPT